jgi:hypothetical protein
MRIIFAFLLICGLALGQEWQAPGPTDKRSPCPVLNTLANHGFLNRNGVGITHDDLVNAFISVLGIDATLADKQAVNGLTKLGYTDSNGVQRLDLDALSKHNVIEHDASLTREDLGDNGDNWTVQPYLVAQLKSLSPDGTSPLGWNEIAKARNLRVKQEKASDPSYSLSLDLTAVALGQGVFVLRILGTGDAIPLEYIDSWFGLEKIPDGFTPHSPAYGVIQFGLDVAKLGALTLIN